jgi:hypothetical protein
MQMHSAYFLESQNVGSPEYVRKIFSRTKIRVEHIDIFRDFFDTKSWAMPGNNSMKQRRALKFPESISSPPFEHVLHKGRSSRD